MTSATAPSSTSDLPIVVVDRRRQRFYTIDNVVLDRYGKELKPTGIAVYNGLARFANRDGECWPSQTTLANLVGMSRVQVNREIKKLEHLKLIAVEHKFGANGQQSANQYTLLDVSEGGDPVTHRYTPRTCELHPPVTESDTPSHRQLHEQHPENKTQIEQDTAEQAVVALMDQGISKKVALHLAKKYSRDQIEEKLDYLAFLQTERPEAVLKPCGWLRKAIEEDYAAPDGYKHATEREAEALRVRQSEEEQQQLLVEQQRQQVAEREQRCQIEAVRLSALHTAFGTTQREVELWKLLLPEFESALPQSSFSYVADTVLLSLKDGEALIGLPNTRARDWLENRLSKKIERTLASALKQKVRVKFIDISLLLQA
jgi:hypothetical protein